MSTKAINQLPEKGRIYFTQLRLNNSREWFNENRAQYESDILNPARDFIVALGERLRTISPAVIADPRVDKSIFRIHRDVRFSKDKSPYKTHLGIFLWEGRAPKLENSGYYLQIEPEEIFLGAGLYNFPKSVLEKYRQAVSEPQWNSNLVAVIKKIQSNGGEIGGDKYKRYPSGYSLEVSDPDLLLYKGIYGLVRINDFNHFEKTDFVKSCFDIFKKLSPLHHWLVKLTNS